MSSIRNMIALLRNAKTLNWWLSKIASMSICAHFWRLMASVTSSSKKRISFCSWQISVLEANFTESQYVTLEQRIRLAQMLHINENQLIQEMFLSFLSLGLVISSYALPKGLVSLPWSTLGIWKSCDNMWCAFGFVCVERKSPEYTGPLCVKADGITCASFDCFPPARCIHIERNDCEKPPCGPSPTCAAPKDNLDPPPTDEVCAKVQCPPDFFCQSNDAGKGQCVRSSTCSKETCQIECSDGLQAADTPYGLQCVPTSVKTLPPPNEYCPMHCVVGSHCEIVPQGPRCIPDKIECGENETKEICGNLCEGKCASHDQEPQECDTCITTACACNDNFYRNDQGKCVPKEECKSYDHGKASDSGKPPAYAIAPPVLKNPLCAAAFCPGGTCVEENGKAKCVPSTEEHPYAL